MILLYGYILYWILAAIGITWGYHRYFAHGGKQQHPVLEIIYLYFGLLCGGRSLLTWAGVHRMHHAYADTENDPHSPKNHPWYVVLFSLWKVKSIPRNKKSYIANTIAKIILDKLLVNDKNFN